MEKNPQNKNIFPFDHDLFLITDGEGKPHWFHSDPLMPKSQNMAECSIAETIFDFVGGARPDVVNPFLVRILVYKKRRGEAFDPSNLESIRRGESDLIVKDLEGNVVEITRRMSNDSSFPLNGIIYDSNGAIDYTRSYSEAGLCSDGVPSHRLVVVKTETEDPVQQ